MKRVVASSVILTVPLFRWSACDDRLDNSVISKRPIGCNLRWMSKSVNSSTKSVINVEFSATFLERCWLSILEPLLTRCDIQEIDSMASVNSSIASDTLLIYDIDNTVFEPTGNYGSDQWFYYLNKVYRMDGLSAEDAEEKALMLWNKTQHLITVMPVEKGIPGLIKEQQQSGIKVIAMTARTKEIAAITFDQLKSIDVSFQQSSVLKDDIILIEMKSSPLLKSDLLFQDGVLFVGEKNGKGDALLMLLEKLKYPPANVVFVDDRMKHLIGTEKALGTISVPFQGFRYGGADEKVKAFDKFTSEVLDEKAVEFFYMGKQI